MTKLAVQEPTQGLEMERPMERTMPFTGWPFGRFFDEAWMPRWTEAREGMFVPSLDLAEFDDAYMAMIELPGMKKDEIQIRFEKGMLTISGERSLYEFKEKPNWLHRERNFGSFYRAMSMPTDVDLKKVEAFFDYGLLRIRMPKAAASKPHAIDIK